MPLDRNLELVGSDSEHQGLYTVGVLVNGAFITLGTAKTGLLDQLKLVPTALAAAEEDEQADDGKASKAK